MGSRTQRTALGRRALLLTASVTAAATLALPVAAADALEEIVVTGSRIAFASAADTRPVTMLGRPQLDASGVDSFALLLRQMPVVAGAMASQQTPTSNNGVEYLNLRGLGPRRGLMLINGRRVVSSQSSADPNSFSAVDLSIVPLSAIERVEVLRDGASAIYGSDAIAGVVNVILRRDVDGVELRGERGISGQGDGQVLRLEGVAGMPFGDRGSVTLFGEYYDRRTVINGSGNRSLGACKLQEAGTGTAANPLRRFCAGSSFNSFPRVVLTGGASPTLGFAANSQVVLRPDLPPSLFDSARDSYNSAPYQVTSSPTRNANLGLDGHVELTSTLRAVVQAAFTSRVSNQILPPGALQSIPVPASNPFNPFGVDVLLNRRTADLGPRDYSQRVRTYRAIGGLEGDLPDLGPLAHLAWDASVSYGRTQGRQITSNIFNRQRIAALGNPVTCQAIGCPVSAGSVNLFSPTAVPQSVYDYIAVATREHGVSELTSVVANLTGTVAELPAGPLAFAAGYEFRRQSGAFTPDPLQAAGLSSDSNYSATAGGYSANEVYAELRAPLVTRRPWVEELSASAAVRASRYSAFGSTWTYKLGASYVPVAPLRLRVLYGTGFRAPNIAELHAGRQQNFPTGEDPCARLASPDPAIVAACRALGLTAAYTGVNGQVPTFDGSNPDLRPEKSRNLTVGAVLTPATLPALRLSADYFFIKVNEAVDYETPVSLLTRCLLTPSGPGCSGVARATSGALTSVTRMLTNTALLRTSGLDLEGSFAVEAGRAGTLTFDAAVTYLLAFDRRVDPGSALQELAGTVSTAEEAFGGSHTRWRGRLGAVLDFGWGSLGYALRYIGPATQYDLNKNRRITAAEALAPHVGAVTYSDLQAQLRYGGATLTAGVENLLDRKPPYLSQINLEAGTTGITAAAANTDYNTYDTIGRFFYVRLGVRF